MVKNGHFIGAKQINWGPFVTFHLFNCILQLTELLDNFALIPIVTGRPCIYGNTRSLFILQIWFSQQKQFNIATIDISEMIYALHIGSAGHWSQKPGKTKAMSQALKLIKAWSNRRVSDIVIVFFM